MADGNPFKYDQIEDPKKGDQFNNINTTRRVRIGNQVYEISQNSTQPDANGIYQDTETMSIVTDQAGNTLPEDGRPYAISWSGLYILSPEKMGTCTSMFHQANISRTILVGQDGHLTPTGAICSRCRAWCTNIYIALGIIFIGCFLGLLKAVGLF
jgi:hypothetical protein